MDISDITCDCNKPGKDQQQVCIKEYSAQEAKTEDLGGEAPEEAQVTATMMCVSKE